MARAMPNSTMPVPYTVSEIAVWISLAAAAVLNLVFAQGTNQLIWAVIWLFILLDLFLSTARAHRRRPDLLARRIPFEIQWLLVLVGVFLASQSSRPTSSRRSSSTACSP
jgi:hypothetical protein